MIALIGGPRLSSQSQQVFINTNYDHRQRGTTGTHTTTFNTDTSFLFDRMFTVPAGASVTSAIDSTAAHLGSALSASGISIIGLASVTTVDHGQIVSSTKRTRYKQPLVFSCSIYNHSGADFTPLLRVDTPATAETNAARTFTNRLSSSLQVCANGAVTRVSAILDPSVSATYTAAVDNGLKVYVRIPSGSLDSNAKDVTISQLSLKPSSFSPGYELPDPGDELLRCLPYYRRVGSGGAGRWSAATVVQLWVSWGAPMVIVPTAKIATTTPLVQEINVAARTGSGSTLNSTASITVSGVVYALDGFSGATGGSVAAGSDDHLAIIAELS